MATPSADIMSSPDPLIDSPAAQSIVMPSSRRSHRITRSVRSTKSIRSVDTSKSPRKQTFELEVGDGRAPQKLLVTVETEDSGTAKSARRKLFQPPQQQQQSSPVSVRRRATTTTTTTAVPLRESIEDEIANGTITPRRRGRPRKSNGTPMPPRTGTKRKASTPAKRTPRQPRAIRFDEEGDVPPEELVAQPTPTPKRRGRPPLNRSRTATAEPPSEAGSDLTQTTGTGTATRRGGRRRQAFAPDELAELVEVLDETANDASNRGIPDDAPPGDDEIDLVMDPDDVDLIMAPIEEPVADADYDGDVREPESMLARSRYTDVNGTDTVANDNDDDSDIWMATLSNDATPRAIVQAHRPTPPPDTAITRSSPRRNNDAATGPSSHRYIDLARGSASRPSPLGTGKEPSPHQDDGEAAEPDYYHYPDAARSDSSSLADDHIPRTNDTIAQGEDFSMIFMDSIPSLQASFHASSRPLMDSHEEIGDETNLIINNTLESLRQSWRKESPEQGEEITETQQEQDPQEDDQEQGKAEQQDREEEEQLEVDVEDMDADIELVMEQPAEEPSGSASPDVDELAQEVSPAPSRSQGHLSPARTLSTRKSRSPRKLHDSPLRRQALNFTARQAEEQAMAQDKDTELEDVERHGLADQSMDDESNIYEDSFSEIPGSVLAAATPRRPPANLAEETFDAPKAAPAAAEQVLEMEDEEQYSEEEAQEEAIEAEEEMEEQHAASNMSIVSRSDNTRLPTPDDTPPYSEVEAAREEVHKAGQATVPSPSPHGPGAEAGVEAEAEVEFEAEYELGAEAEVEAAPGVEVESQAEAEAEAEEESPVSLRISLSADARPPQREDDTIRQTSMATKTTPINQMSSPVQEPQSLGVEALNENFLRPALSPIVRAGRALQSVTSDPPSPDRVERQLGSPFRSSVSKDSWSGSKESQNGRRMSAGSPRQAAALRDQPILISGRLSEDPFTAPSKTNGQAGFMQALTQSVMTAASKERSPFRASAGSSMRVSHAGDEMSWVADEGPLSPRLRGDNTLKDTVQAAGSTAVASERRLSSASGRRNGAAADDDVDVDVDVNIEDDRHSDEGNESEMSDGGPQAAADDDETNIWEFEARREMPGSARQQPFGNRVASSAHRRRGLPSPWKTAMSQRAQEQQQQQQEDAVGSPINPLISKQRPYASSQAPDDDEAPEYSLLSQQRRQQQQRGQEQEAAPSSTAKSKAFDLASFFSSPAAFPGMLAKKFLPSKPSDDAPPKGPQSMPTTSMFPQAPQPQARTGVTQATSSVSTTTQSQQQLEEDQEIADDDDGNDNGGEDMADEDEGSPASAARQPKLPTVAQKQNFTPRPKQPSRSFFQPSSARTSTVTTPPRMQLSHADIQRWQQETSNASSSSPAGPAGPASLRPPLLRPLPPKNASPTKSSLRSPLKPHTPGRVVEFTSSVLSPMEQARVRMERQRSVSTAATGGEEEYYTGAPDISMNDASPAVAEMSSRPQQQQQPQPQQQQQQLHPPPPESLSQTVWTRQHWLLLDALLQLRRRGELDLDGPFPGARGGSSSSGGSASDRFLGKTVKSHGETMRLERWHLECVDAFRAEVGGWDEAVLVKRLSALLMGEEKRKRRRRSAVARQRPVAMFH